MMQRNSHLLEQPRAIQKFWAHYWQTTREGIARLDTEALQTAAGELRAMVSGRKGTIYLFGNGGSCAILKTFDLHLRQMMRPLGPVRTRHGIDVHETLWRSRRTGYAGVFVDQLNEEHAGPEDLAILVSGSGDSDNVVRAAAHCIKQQIPMIAAAAFDGGRLAQTVRPPSCFVAPVHDQQIGEDVLQAGLYIVGRAARTQNILKELFDYLERMHQVERSLDPMILIQISEAIAQAYADGRSVHVLAPTAGPVGISAEHTAHNLNWDAVYGITNPPPRRIYSTPGACDLSGIQNDRTPAGIVSVQQLERGQPGDVVVFYLHTPADEEAVKNAISKASHQGMRMHFLFVPDPGSAVFASNLLQMIGHMIGRMTRAVIRMGRAEIREDDLETVLINEDMAQRRLLGVVDGL